MSLPIIVYVWDILYSSPVPAGGDPADHALFTMKIVDSGNPLIEYTQFPTLRSEQNNIQAYYPSFLHILMAIPAYSMHLMGITLFNSVISSMTATMFHVVYRGDYWICSDIVPIPHKRYLWISL